jgi:hypothetical protein
MNSTLKTVVTLGLIVLFVSAVTLITQFSVTTSPTPGAPGGPSADGSPAGPPLTLNTAEIHFDPVSDGIANRAFTGYFEVSDTIHWVSFWFKNDNPFPVNMAIRERSCSSCTSARMTIVPEDEIRAYTSRTATTGLPWSPFPLPDLVSPIAFAGLELNRKRDQNDPGTPWHYFNFERQDDSFTVPAAPAAGRPTVGILALGFKAQQPGPPKTITAVLVASGPDEKSYSYPFAVTYAPTPPFHVLPVEASVGDLPEGAPPQSYEVIVYSNTRLPGTLPPPVAAVEGNDPFVSVGKPVELTDADMDILVRRAKAEANTDMRVLSGYRMPVTIHREAAEKLADIGKYEKTIHVSVPGTTSTGKSVIRGRVTGLLQLDAEDKIALGTYTSSRETRNDKSRVFTTRKDMELEVDPARCLPLFVQYTLGSPVTEGERKVWPVVVTIPANEGRKPSWEGVVAFRAKTGGKQVNIRIPVTGNGAGR